MIRRVFAIIAVAWLVGSCSGAGTQVTSGTRSTDPKVAELLDRLEAVRQAEISDEFKELAQQAVHDVLKARLNAELSRLPSSPSLAERGHGSSLALVIGNGNYRYLPNLATAVADAEAVAGILASRYGFEVTLLRNATRYQILASLDGLRHILGANDELLVFYSGHSERSGDDAASHWLPVDAQAESSANWISTREVADILASLPARHAMVLADAAFGDVLAPTALGVPPGGRARTALSSGRLAPTLDAGGGSHSVFSQALLDTLEAAETSLPGSELEREVAARMRFKVNAFEGREPRYGPIGQTGHAGGDFVLAPSLHPGRVDTPPEPETEGTRRAEDLLVVDCLLPPKVRRLARVEFVPPRRAARTSALDCERRGGEFVAHSNANPATTLRVWLQAAEAGNSKAQTYVGEAFERGPDGSPDFARAAHWYRRAAEQNFAPAQINLGQLYERGLGVPQDEAIALDWYRRAAHSAPSVALASLEPAVAAPGGNPLDERELTELQRAVARLEQRAKADADFEPTEPDGPVITMVEPSLSFGGEVVPVFPGVARRQIVGRVDAPAGLLSLVMNDRPLSADDFQMFRAEIAVPAVGTPVTIVAIDRRGRRADVSFMLQPETSSPGRSAARAAGPPLHDLQILADKVSQARPAFARPAFQCLDDLRQCGRAGFAWLDCQLTMLVCVFDLALP